MRIAFLSDIHGNLEALNAVLADLETREAEATACLGDVIGYGPDPEACAELVRERGMPCVLGNHEWGLVRPENQAWFNPQARRSLLQTRDMLSPRTLDWLGGLPVSLVVGPCLLVHGAPPDSVTTYLFQLGDRRLARLLEDMPQPFCCVGHTHELKLVSLTDGGLERRELGRGLLELPPARRHLFNAGSVGQPRDGDRNAKYVILDSDAVTLEVRFVAYDAEATAAKIRARGLPEINARRLL